MNLFDLFVKIGVKDEATSKVSELSSKLGNGLKTAAKIGTAAVGVAATAVAALTKSSVENYAEYEQLVGGVETLFKKNADVVQKYAANAYKTAGLSANEYMETVTSFSASLLQSLDNDTKAAAKKANLAITDMSDNANKMGTSMESIQNAYQGFAKQNFTMLDNLKLGFGGTKEEMQRLLDTASKISGMKYDISSYADIVDAIHVVQTEMGITGTTAKEASTTIQGSVSAMKSSWENLVTGIADDNADLDNLIGNFIESVSTAGENLIPRIEQILSGIGNLVTGLAPVISEAVPGLVTNVLPSLLNAGVQLIDGILQGLIVALPGLAKSAVSIVKTLANSIVKQLPDLLKTSAKVIEVLVNGILEMLPDIIKLGLDLIVSLANGLTKYLPKLIPTVISIVLKIVETLTNPKQLSNLINAALNLILALVDGLLNSNALGNLMKAAIQIIVNLINYLLDPNNISKLISSAIQLVDALVKGIIGSAGEIANAALQLIQQIITKFKNTDWGSLGRNIVSGLLNGLKNSWSSIKTWFSEKISGLVSSAKSLLGIHSPSTVFAGIGKNMVLGLKNGWEDNFDSAEKEINNSLKFNPNVSYTFGSDSANSGSLKSKSISIVQNIYSQSKTAAELMQEARWQAKMGVLSVV